MSLVEDILKLDREKQLAVAEAARLRAALEREKSKYDFLLPEGIRSRLRVEAYRSPRLFAQSVVIGLEMPRFHVAVPDEQLAQARFVEPFIAHVARDTALRFYEALAVKVGTILAKEAQTA